MSGREKTQGTRCAFIAVGGDPQKKWDPKKLDVGTLLTWDGNGFMMKRQCGTQTMEPSQIKTLVFFGTNQLILIRVKFLCQSVIPGRVMRFIHQGNGNQLFQN